MSILCVIPARKGSKEVKNKNWKKINGKHLIEYTFDAVKKSKKINKTIVSTNDPAIIKLCIKHKINYTVYSASLNYVKFLFTSGRKLYLIYT